ncbi:MAG: hypothetical protein Q4B54_12215 [Coriobacteriales bacterium]|nr:hypothetical protein [Coriobacteriales bacterium]
MDTNHAHKPTPLFLHYVVLLLIRLVLFAVGIWLFFTHPEQLDMSAQFGFSHGVSFVNVAFVALLLDLLTKFRPRAKISMGSRKQYAQYHAPTPRLFKGGIKELRERALKLMEEAPTLLENVMYDTRQAVQETAQGVYAAGKQLAYSADILRVLPWPEEDLTASEQLRESIRRHRMREIIPVAIFWVVFNLAIGLLLDRFGLLNPQTIMLWTLFYFVFDLISVVLWCPLQLALMRNRCCTTCQIFNWDGAMTVTPLLALGCWFSWILIVIALIVLVRWELAFMRHPERFDERTNASLLCANCKDQLCYLRKPLRPRKRSYN